MEVQEEYVKILFRFYSNVLEQETVETMWATGVDADKGLYKLDNIPFYVPSVASDDIVHATYDANEKMLVYQDAVEYSGNSIIHVVVLDKNRSADVLREIFDSMGCASEKLNEKYFAIEVAAANDYTAIKDRLNELEDQGVISYAESCLSDNHIY